MSATTRATREQALLEVWRQRGVWAWILWPVSLLYGVVFRLRRTAYRWGLLRSRRPQVPVIVVGNLIVGGAGKTPVVLALVEALSRQGWRVGVISRGHGRRHDQAMTVTPASLARDVGDEPLLLQRRAGVPVVVARDRLAAAEQLLAEHPEVNLIVSDDGLQHSALARDLQVLVFDERGAGNGFLLPAGPLREPMPRQCPSHTLVIYNAAQASTPLPGHVGLRQLQGLVPWAEWKDGAPGSPQQLQAMAQRSQRTQVWAAAGIAQPERFFAALRQAHVHFTPLPLPDHHAFEGEPPWPAHATVLLTEKDAVKLSPGTLGSADVWVAPLDFRLSASFTDALTALMHTLSLYPSSTPHGHPTA